MKKTKTVTSLAGTSGSVRHRLHKSSYIVTAASTRARESVAQAGHGKVHVTTGGTKITGPSGLRKSRGVQ